MAEADRRLAEVQDRARRAAMGEPVPFSDTALDQAAIVLEGDTLAALSLWDRTVRPRSFRGLLDAEVID